MFDKGKRPPHFVLRVRVGVEMVLNGAGGRDEVGSPSCLFLPLRANDGYDHGDVSTFFAQGSAPAAGGLSPVDRSTVAPPLSMPNFINVFTIRERGFCFNCLDSAEICC